MKNPSLKMFAAASVIACSIAPAFAENSESAGALEFVRARPALENLDFRAQSKVSPELRPSERKQITLPPELPRFRPVTIYLTMGTGF